MRYSQLMFIEKRPSVGCIPALKAFYLKQDCWLTNVLRNVKTKYWHQKQQYLKKIGNRPAIFG